MGTHLHNRRPPSSAQKQALAALILWRALFDAREGLMLDALLAGCSYAEVAEASGYSRDTIYTLIPVDWNAKR